MIRSAATKVMWVGRATVFLVGLAAILALVLGVASMAFGANGGNFILGQLNRATATTQLNGNVSGGPALRVNNTRTERGSRALQLAVAQDKAPITVNANAGKATNLNSDKLDGLDSSQLVQGRISVSGTTAQSFGAFVHHFEGFGNYGGGFRRVVTAPEKANPINMSVSCTNSTSAGTLRIENTGEFGDSQVLWIDDGSTSPSFTTLLAGNSIDRSVPANGDHLTIRVTNVFNPIRMTTIEMFTRHGNTGCDVNSHAVYTFDP